MDALLNHQYELSREYNMINAAFYVSNKPPRSRPEDLGIEVVTAPEVRADQAATNFLRSQIAYEINTLAGDLADAARTLTVHANELMDKPERSAHSVVGHVLKAHQQATAVSGSTMWQIIHYLEQLSDVREETSDA